MLSIGPSGKYGSERCEVGVCSTACSLRDAGHFGRVSPACRFDLPHSILKRNVHETIRRINEVHSTTLGGCGDGPLTVRKSSLSENVGFGFDLDACRLTVSSACETRLEHWSRGHEIVRLERALLRADRRRQSLEGRFVLSGDWRGTPRATDIVCQSSRTGREARPTEISLQR